MVFLLRLAKVYTTNTLVTSRPVTVTSTGTSSSSTSGGDGSDSDNDNSTCMYRTHHLTSNPTDSSTSIYRRWSRRCGYEQRRGRCIFRNQCCRRSADRCGKVHFGRHGCRFPRLGCCSLSMGSCPTYTVVDGTVYDEQGLVGGPGQLRRACTRRWWRAVLDVVETG